MDGGRHILLIDDEEAVRRLLRLHLELEGYHVSEADEGRKGLERARADPPDVIVLDLGMAGMDGWQVLVELRADPGLSCVPVVMLTGRAEEADELRARALGAVAYVAKPVACEDLVATIRRFDERGERT